MAELPVPSTWKAPSMQAFRATWVAMLQGGLWRGWDSCEARSMFSPAHWSLPLERPAGTSTSKYLKVSCHPPLPCLRLWEQHCGVPRVCQTPGHPLPTAQPSFHFCKMGINNHQSRDCVRRVSTSDEHFIIITAGVVVVGLVSLKGRWACPSL